MSQVPAEIFWQNKAGNNVKPRLVLYRKEAYAPLHGITHWEFAVVVEGIEVGSYAILDDSERSARRKVWEILARKIWLSQVPAEIFWQNKAGKMAVKTCLSHLSDGVLVAYKHVPPDRFFDQVEWLNNPDWCTKPMVEELLERVRAKVSSGEKDPPDEALLQKILDKEIKIKVIEVHCLPDGTKKVEVIL
jgi:hypothetical protein